MKLRMSKKHAVCGLAASFIILCALAYLANFVLEEGSKEIGQALQTRGGSLGVGLQNIKFEDADISLNRELVWRNISAEGKLSDKFGFDPNIIYYLLIKQAKVRFDAIAKARFSFEVSNLNVSPQGYLGQSGKISYQNVANVRQGARLDVSLLKLHFNLGSYSRRAVIDGIKKELSGLLDIIRDGESSANIQLLANLEFNINDKQVKARIQVVPRGKRYRLVMDKNDMKALARNYAGEVSEIEIELLAEYPRRFSTLLLLKEYAELKATEMNKKEAVPEDAYRHVLWSYKLTKEFGPDFAKLVTDAHEKGDIVDSTADHKMDYNNNALGREYAGSGVEEEELVGKVFGDKRVVRVP